jgi:hypothetical protein
VIPAGIRDERRRSHHFVEQPPGSRNERQVAFHGALRQHPRDHEAVDLVRAFENAIHPRVAIVPLGRVVANIAVAAMNLHVLVEDEIENLAA